MLMAASALAWASRPRMVYFLTRSSKVVRVLDDPSPLPSEPRAGPSDSARPEPSSTPWFLWGRRGFSLLAAIFVVLAAWRLVERWGSTAVTLDWPWLVPAFVLASVAMACQFLAWFFLLKSWTGGVSPPWAASARLYIDSQLARYTPGKIGLAAVRLSGSERLGVAPRVMASTILAELASFCAWGAFLGMLLLSAYPGRFGLLGKWSAPLVLLGLLALCAVVILSFASRDRLPRGLVHKLGATGRGAFLPWATALWHALHFLCWVGVGAACALALGASLADALAIGAGLCLAIVGGFLALLAPAGVGVREVIIAVLAEPILGASGAVALSLVTRGLSLTSDVTLWLAARWLAAR